MIVESPRPCSSICSNVAPGLGSSGAAGTKQETGSTRGRRRAFNVASNLQTNDFQQIFEGHSFSIFRLPCSDVHAAVNQHTARGKSFQKDI